MAIGSAAYKMPCGIIWTLRKWGKVTLLSPFLRGRETRIFKGMFKESHIPVPDEPAAQTSSAEPVLTDKLSRFLKRLDDETTPARSVDPAE